MNINKLKILRENADLTQKKVAKDLNIGRTTYAMYEQGNNEPNHEMLRQIAQYYNVSTDYLLDLTDDYIPTNEFEFLKKLDHMSIDELNEEYNFTYDGVEIDKEILEAFVNLFKILKKKINK